MFLTGVYHVTSHSFATNSMVLKKKHVSKRCSTKHRASNGTLFTWARWYRWYNDTHLGVVPRPRLPVTTRITSLFSRGSRTKPWFATVTGREHPQYIKIWSQVYMYTYKWGNSTRTWYATTKRYQSRNLNDEQVAPGFLATWNQPCDMPNTV